MALDPIQKIDSIIKSHYSYSVINKIGIFLTIKFLVFILSKILFFSNSIIYTLYNSEDAIKKEARRFR
jgi:hypothetical protein